MKNVHRFFALAAMLATFLTTRALFAGEIHDAAAQGDVKEVEKLLDADKELLDEKVKWRNEDEHWGLEGTPLHIATIHGQDEVVKFLLSKGANAKALDESDFTPLHLAAFRSYK